MTTLPCDDDPELFFEAEHERGAPKLRRIAAAKAICATCPLATREACLEIALKAEGGAKTGRYGVFGGYDPEQRAAIAEARELEPPSAWHPAHGTPAGAQKHRRLGEDVCGPCLSAETEAQRHRAQAKGWPKKRVAA